MCGRYTLSKPQELVDELREVLGDLGDERLTATDRSDLLRPRFNVAPTQLVPAVLGDAESAHMARLTLARWGLGSDRPRSRSSSRTARRRSTPPLINARVETVVDKRSFAQAFEQRRCLVPADGFYEWTGPSTARQPHLLTLEESDEAPPRSHHGCCFAGIWQPGLRAAEGSPEPPATFSILTTSANERVRPLHDRMPIAIPPTSWKLWLEPTESVEQLLELLASRPVVDAARWRSHPVSVRVNKVGYDDPELVLPTAPAPFNLPLF
jgi:putative SOS response-associated peptidase YedK